MRREWITYPLYLLAVTVVLCLGGEYAAKLFNRAAGAELPFLLMKEMPPDEGTPARRDVFTLLDPHLGYAHGESEPSVQEFKKRYRWDKAFGIYSGAPLDRLERPIILALGGSTTDPVQFGHSWPEELSKLMVEHRVAGTVINGATGGYSTNQELLKLIRDGLEWKPDIVISYSGVNDRGDHGPFPNPMVNPYQRQLLDVLLRRVPSRLMPNTVRALQRLFNRGGHLEGFTLGISTASSPGEWYARNLALMQAVTRSSGARFYAIIQPNAYVGEHQRASKFNGRRSADYIAKLRRLYRETKDLPLHADYVRDFTAIFKEIDAYTTDGIHVTQEGDRIIARHIFDLIAPDIGAPGERSEAPPRGSE